MVVGTPMEVNAIYCGDCKDVLAHFPDKSVDLIYIDPPFFTGKNYEIIFKDGYEIRSFKDAHWYDKEGRRREDIYVYLDWLKDRIVQCHRVLKDTGSFYLHCDWHANSYIRVVVLDKVFEKNNFRNEIIWTYTRPGTKHQKQFPRVHDTIFWYSKSKTWTFNPHSVRIPYSKKTIERGKYSVETSKVTPGIKKRVLDKEGKTPEDYWHIPMIQGNARERLGYPTQKPETLLERIIKASSNPNDIVLDPMCGCGTAIAVAHKLKRRWVGVEISPTGCNLMEKRMKKIGAMPKMIGLPATVEDLMKIEWFDFQNWVVRRLGGRATEKKVRDKGIDGATFEGIPVQVKQSEKVGRVVVDDFHSAVRRYYSGSKRAKKGIIVAFSFTGDAYDEVARLKLQNEIEIELRTVEELLKGD